VKTHGEDIVHASMKILDLVHVGGRGVSTHQPRIEKEP